MKITIDLLKYFGILLYNAPCIRLSAMTRIYNNTSQCSYIIIHLHHLEYFMTHNNNGAFLSPQTQQKIILLNQNHPSNTPQNLLKQKQTHHPISNTNTPSHIYH